MRAVRVLAPAKINPFLGVRAKLRPDGYHGVITVMHALSLHDTVSIVPAEGLTVVTSVDLGIPAEKNLAHRAATAFATTFRVPAGAVIEIEKRIPSGAGLGGGSSDAAAVLLGLAYLHDIAPGDARLVAIARELGADCPFFLHGGAAVMRERGDRVARTLPAITADVVLVKPAEPVATAEAYRAFDQAPPPMGDIRLVTDALCFRDLPALAAGLSNNLTPISSALVPPIADALAWVRASEGVLGAEMAGSGSAVFGLCEDAESARTIADAARERGWWGIATTTSTYGARMLDDEGDE